MVIIDRRGTAGGAGVAGPDQPTVVDRADDHVTATTGEADPHRLT